MLHVYYMGKFLILWASLRPERNNNNNKNNQMNKQKRSKNPNNQTKKPVTAMPGT